MKNLFSKYGYIISLFLLVLLASIVTVFNHNSKAADKPVEYPESATFWAYQVTDIQDNGSVLGENAAHTDFPTVEFELTDIKSGDTFEVGDWVIVIYSHDYIFDVLKWFDYEMEEN